MPVQLRLNFAKPSRISSSTPAGAAAAAAAAPAYETPGIAVEDFPETASDLLPLDQVAEDAREKLVDDLSGC